ncbi:hypothetical protein NBT05_05350 [Aquimarina sp. ERC-38]|uniref:hypothetical protein n=1 Tax=Aquimarina sp. ERC-38 TaxID=2949996 RepID=UPI0022474E8B|nr:hypothetical protein [Aquimarina sp. ERC-38]UZO81891.1 hypothetical protein NBT05_05350 [Aquimarina sp. ERC-38]
MKFESIKIKKFQEEALNKKQMENIKANGIATAGGRTEAPHGANGALTQFDYGYDAIRDNGDGTTRLTFHNRSNFCTVPCLSDAM